MKFLARVCRRNSRVEYGGNGASSKRVCAVGVAVQGKESGGIGGSSRSKVARVKKRNHGAGSNCIHLTVRSSSPTYTKGAHAIRGYKTLGTKHIRGYKSLGTNRQARGQAVSHTLKAQLGEEPGVLALLVLFGEHLAAN
jgi:hypothetical protein